MQGCSYKDGVTKAWDIIRLCGPLYVLCPSFFLLEREDLTAAGMVFFGLILWFVNRHCASVGNGNLEVGLKCCPLALTVLPCDVQLSPSTVVDQEFSLCDVQWSPSTVMQQVFYSEHILLDILFFLRGVPPVSFFETNHRAQVFCAEKRFAMEIFHRLMTRVVLTEPRPGCFIADVKTYQSYTSTGILVLSDVHRAIRNKHREQRRISSLGASVHNDWGWKNFPLGEKIKGATFENDWGWKVFPKGATFDNG